jgi:UTP:GlnB (protein PII) uridylyltransferase
MTHEFEPHGELAFYEWLDDVLTICRPIELSIMAGIPPSSISMHRGAMDRFKKTEVMGGAKLRQEYFAPVARAVMKATHGTIVIRWDTFQLDAENRICIHTANGRGRTVLHPLTDVEFNELF